jgi:hypothetical protein
LFVGVHSVTKTNIKQSIQGDLNTYQDFILLSLFRHHRYAGHLHQELRAREPDDDDDGDGDRRRVGPLAPRSSSP